MSGPVSRAFAAAVAATVTASVASAGGRLLFRSGFERDTRLVKETSGWIDIVGTDRSVAPPNDWTKAFRRGGLGSFRFQYAGGDTSQRKVTIERDPNGSPNRVLRYWMRQVNVSPNASWGGKGRIQANIAGNSSLRDFTYRVRMYFHEDWKHLRDWNGRMGWFILAEFWNNANWTREGHPFRIHVTIANDANSGSSLRFGVGAQIDDRGWKNVWHKRNGSYAIPLKQWLTAEIHLKEGKGRGGRFYLAVTGADGKKSVIFDVRDTTHHPDDRKPDGFRQFNPLKMYTHNRNVKRVRDKGGALQIYWDDFELWTGRAP